MPWVFRTYRRASGRDDVREWYDALAAPSRAVVLNVLQYLRVQERQNWARPDFGPLHGKCASMGELRFKFGGVQNRLIGYFGPNRMNFTILLPLTKRGRTFDPRDWENTALRRRAEVEADPGCSDVWLA
jgi:hypothetical protein